MYIFFNSASFVGQATTTYEGGLLLDRMMRTVEGLIEISGEEKKESAIKRMYRDAPLQSRPLVPDKKYKEVVQRRYKDIADIQPEPTTKDDVDEADRFTRFLDIIAALPTAGEVLALPEHVCDRGNKDVSHEALGYAAHYAENTPFEGTGCQAVIVSLDGCAAFMDAWISVDYARNDAIEERRVWNVRQATDVNAEKRTYDENGKHTFPDTKYVGFVARMHLPSGEAQRVLHRAAVLPDEKRLFAHHNGIIYIFPCHDENRHAYHGFPVSASDLRQSDQPIYNALHKYFPCWKLPM